MAKARWCAIMLVGGGKEWMFEAPRQDTPNTHGTGCTLATAIACGVALEMDLPTAVKRAHAYGPGGNPRRAPRSARQAATGLGSAQL